MLHNMLNYECWREFMSVLYNPECENRLCIYYEDGRCCAGKININSQGICDACILLDFDERELKLKRIKLLSQLEAQYQHSVAHIEKRVKEIYPCEEGDGENI